MDIGEGKTRPKKPNLAEIREKLLCKRTTEAFTDYRGVESDPGLTLVEKMIKLQKQSAMRLGGKFTLCHCWENCYKVALMNQRKPTRKHSSRPRSKGGEHSSYVNCTNSLTNTSNSPSALYLFVLFVITLKR